MNFFAFSFVIFVFFVPFVIVRHLLGRSDQSSARITVSTTSPTDLPVVSTVIAAVE